MAVTSSRGRLGRCDGVGAAESKSAGAARAICFFSWKPFPRKPCSARGRFGAAARRECAMRIGRGRTLRPMVCGVLSKAGLAPSE